ncbi:hypothetical protein BDW22DRAFT_1347800 [Trametopsis cervina]|nr:hypothetical protein BDW22DRAFT_1347800 [Trametopsis cervina]
MNGTAINMGARTFMTSRPAADPAKAEKDAAVKTAAAKKPAAKKATATKPTEKTKSAKTAKPAGKKAKAMDIRGHMPPKRPKNGYLLFLQDKREGSNFKATSTEGAAGFVKDAAAEWRAMNAEEKEKWAEKARVPMEEYIAARAEYIKNTPPAVLKEINKRRREKGLQRVKTPHTRMPGPFMLFSKDYYNEHTRSAIGDRRTLVAQSGKQAGERWRNMSAAEKQPYFDAFERNRQAHASQATVENA